MTAATLNAQDSAELFNRPISTLYTWAKTHGLAEFDNRFGEKRFDLVAVYFLDRGDRFGLRQYKAGLLSDEQIDEIKASIGVGGSATGQSPNALVPLAIEPSTRVPATLRSQLFADAAAEGRAPLDVLVNCYAAKCGIVSEIGK